MPTKPINIRVPYQVRVRWEQTTNADADEQETHGSSAQDMNQD